MLEDMSEESPQGVHPVLLRDQTEGESPDVWYSIYRYMDRMFAERRPHRRTEIAALDLEKLSPRARYLMRHLLVLQGRYVETLRRYPNLRPLQREAGVVLDEPIVLSDSPRHAWAWLRKQNIFL